MEHLGISTPMPADDGVNGSGSLEDADIHTVSYFNHPVIVRFSYGLTACYTRTLKSSEIHPDFNQRTSTTHRHTSRLQKIWEIYSVAYAGYCISSISGQRNDVYPLIFCARLGMQTMLEVLSLVSNCVSV